MAWTSPITHAVGDMATFTMLNAQVRDNFLNLDQHAHGGAAGDGASSMGNLVKATFTDAAAPAAPGAGKTAVYTNAGTVHFRAGGAGSDLTISDTTHTH